MACPPISTGVNFLYGTLNHIDCQAQSIGSYGYGALSDTNSFIFIALTGLLTVFVAIYGVRLVLSGAIASGNFVADAIKVGVVLTLATSWPAWRTIGYDVVMNGPYEIAQTIGLASGLNRTTSDLPYRLQELDNSLVTLTTYGTGRLSGGVVAGGEAGNSFEGIALADQFSLGIGRAAFLAGVLVPFGIYRLGAGILLALAPLMAGLLLFKGSVGIFLGWLRGLVFCSLGSLMQLLVQGVEVSLLDPWLTSAIERRGSGLYTPSAPTELLVMSLTFAGITIGLFFLTIRICFYSGVLQVLIGRHYVRQAPPAPQQSYSELQLRQDSIPSRSQMITETVGVAMRREGIGAGQTSATNLAPLSLPAAMVASARGNDGLSMQNMTRNDAKRTTVSASTRTSAMRDRK